jgi:osmotically-inducible protein OsmY
MPHVLVRFQSSLIVALLAVWLGGCAGAAVGAGATVGVAAYQERGVETAAKDLRLEVQIIDLWYKRDNALPVKLGVEVYEGRALLTGIIDDAQVRADVVGLAWQVEGVKEVLNEIQVTGGRSVYLARDSWITAQLKSKLLFDDKISAINYNIETVNGIVYLIGIGQNQEEVDRVTAHARNISYVRRVISHVRLKKAV